MTPRFAVRRATSDDGLTMYWLVEAATGKRLVSNVSRDTLERYAAVMNERHPTGADYRQEAGSW